MSDSVRPHRQQPTRLPHPWDSPGKNTGVGCHFLLQCVKVKSESEVTQSCPTLRNPMDCSLPGSSAHRDFPGKSTGVGCHCLLRSLLLLLCYCQFLLLCLLMFVLCIEVLLCWVHRYLQLLWEILQTSPRMTSLRQGMC